MKFKNRNFIIRIISCCLSFVIFCSLMLPVSATDSIGTLEQSTSNLQNELTSLQSELTSLSSEISTISAQAASIHAEIAEVQSQYNEETSEEEEIYVNLNDDGTFMAGTEYSVILYVALSNDEDEDGVDDTTGICLPENEEDIPDFPAVVDGEFVEMDKAYYDGMLVYTYTFPATEGDGVTISGKVTSFGTGTTTVELLDENGNDAGFTPCTGTETEFTYTFTNVPAGDYIIRVKKANHVTRDYKVSVE